MSYTGESFLYAAPWLALLPPNIWFDTEKLYDGKRSVRFQKGEQLTLEQTRDAITKAFGLTEPWRKQYNKWCSWWEYENQTTNGVRIQIFGDSVGPASCQRIECTVEEYEDVPVVYEKRLVTKTKVEWRCPDNAQ